VSLWPSCEFDDCDSDGAPAVAIVPQVSFGMTEPYAWVLSCADCIAAAGGATRVDDRLVLVRPDALGRLAGEAP
jgi:hypothetical protein